MTKYAAFGADLKIGVKQVETATVVGTITGSGNATFTLTAAGMTGSPIATSVAVLENDTAHAVAVKAAAAMNLDSDITDLFTVTANGPYLIITRVTGAANDATLNIAFTNDTCTGLTPDATSDNTIAGVALTSIAQVETIGGPGLSVDTEDVTTHDSTNAFEEMVATIIRTGDVSLDIVYDPAGATHDASTGLIYYLENKKKVFLDLIFRSTYNWTMDGYITGFEPSAPVGGKLSASVTIKIDGAPTLE